MRIALIVERFEPQGGGIEHAVWQLARELAANPEDELHVFARRGHEAGGIQLHRVPTPSFWQPLRVVAFSRQCARLLRRASFDLIHSFSRTRHQDIFHAGGGSHADYMQRTYSPLAARLRRLSPRHALLLSIERRIFADPSQTIQCVSPMVQEQIEARFGVPAARLKLVPYGVDPERFHPSRRSREGPALRAELGTGEEVVWLFAGSGWRRKGLDTALVALSRSRDSKSQLWIAGRDRSEPWRQLAERHGVADRVRFLGERADMERVYAAADGLLFPTRYDAFGLVGLEAAAAGLPVVSSAAAGVCSLLADACEIVSDPEDSGAFARALDDLSDPHTRARLGAEGRRIAEANSWTLAAGRMRALYRDVTGAAEHS